MVMSESRRRILKTIALGGGAISSTKLIPDTWTKPVVNTIGIPAHALTTPAEGTGVFRTNGSIEVGALDQAVDEQQIAADDQFSGSVMDYFIESAEAQLVPLDPVRACFLRFNSSISLNLSFNIPQNPGDVTVCVGGAGPSNIQTTTSIDGSAIGDFCAGCYDFTDCVLSDDSVSGYISRGGGMIKDPPLNNTLVQEFVVYPPEPTRFVAPLVEDDYTCPGANPAKCATKFPS